MVQGVAARGALRPHGPGAALISCRLRGLVRSLGERRYPAHFASKLTDALSEAEETLTWLRFADACGYLRGVDLHAFVERYRGVIGGLVRMLDDADAWCSPRTR
jgi:hypothetical protein